VVGEAVLQVGKMCGTGGDLTEVNSGADRSELSYQRWGAPCGGHSGGATILGCFLARQLEEDDIGSLEEVKGAWGGCSGDA
jgi:hypothetical protein